MSDVVVFTVDVSHFRYAAEQSTGPKGFAAIKSYVKTSIEDMRFICDYAVAREHETHTLKALSVALTGWIGVIPVHEIATHLSRSAEPAVTLTCGLVGLFGAVATLATFPAIMKNSQPKEPIYKIVEAFELAPGVT